MNEPELRSIGIVDVRFGKNVTVVQPVNLYGCRIDDDSFVGPFVEVQKGAQIGKRCRIQSHAFVCELVTIGDTKLGNGVSVGTNASILPVTICDKAVIGAGAVVTKDITEPGVYAGNPARLLRRL